MNKDSFVIGVDYGTDSVRTIIANVQNGKEIASSVFNYPRWKSGLYCDPQLNQFRQHPLDYLEGLEHTIKECLQQAGENIFGNIKAISIDTTGSTPVAVDAKGTPLALHEEFKDNPNAMFILWKDHTAAQEAEEINQHAAKFDTDYLRYVGGIYSSEWFWAKLLHVLRTDEAVRKHCYSWVEHCDWMPFLLTGGTTVSAMKRSVCAAGHKAVWAEEFGGLPPNEFFASLDNLLDGFTSRLYTKTYTSSQPAGFLSNHWAEKFGLTTDVVVGVGAIDAHMGAVGGQIEPYFLSKVIGTSTCDMLIAPAREVTGKFVPGICGIVDGSIVPGYIGMEAGQSAFGDIFAWFRDLLIWPMKQLQHPEMSNAAIDYLAENVLVELSNQAGRLPLEDASELSIDWFNGRRTPDADPFLKGAITGLTLGSDAPRIFRSLVESACFGSKAIIERFIEKGIPVRGLIGSGGIAKKSPFVMQMLADITGMPIQIARSEQACALGAAMFAATAAGVYETVDQAMKAMGQGFERTYMPDEQKKNFYKERYKKYTDLCDFMEGAK